MPHFSAKAEKLVRELARRKAVDRASGRTITSPSLAAPLVNAGALAKATSKRGGGSQVTLYWLTPTGLALRAGLDGPRCRYCSCTEMNACRRGCCWVAPGVCSTPSCVRKFRRDQARRSRALEAPA